MRKRRPCFVKRQARKNSQNRGVWFDVYEDWGLIESSFVAQYGIRLRQEDEMSWGEFITLLGGLMQKTPLGQVISVRSENNKDMLKNFTKDQHKIRNEWRSRMYKLAIANEAEARRQIKMFQEAMKKAFGKQ